MASRMAARSTTPGTPVKSCSSTRAGVKAISLRRARLRVPAGQRLDVVRGDRLRRPRCAAGSRAGSSASTAAAPRRTSTGARRGGRSRSRVRRRSGWLRTPKLSEFATVVHRIGVQGSRGRLGVTLNPTNRAWKPTLGWCPRTTTSPAWCTCTPPTRTAPGRCRRSRRLQRETGVDVVLLTDHDTLGARRAGDERWHGSVLVLVGEEVSPSGGNHYLAFGVDQASRRQARRRGDLRARSRPQAASASPPTPSRPVDADQARRRHALDRHRHDGLDRHRGLGASSTDTGRPLRSSPTASASSARPDAFRGPRRRSPAWPSGPPRRQRRRVVGDRRHRRAPDRHPGARPGAAPAHVLRPLLPPPAHARALREPPTGSWSTTATRSTRPCEPAAATWRSTHWPRRADSPSRPRWQPASAPMGSEPAASPVTLRAQPPARRR